MRDESLDPKQSLEVIHSMIRSARNRIAHDGFLFIFWGWLIFCGALSHYFLISINVAHPELIWPAISIAGAGISIIHGIRHRRTITVVTYIDRYMAFTWVAFMLGITITMTYITVNGIRATYFFAMILYGIATLITGGLLNFKPMIAGSFFSFVFAFLSIRFAPQDLLLLLAACMLASYIIPGHILRYKNA